MIIWCLGAHGLFRIVLIDSSRLSLLARKVGFRRDRKELEVTLPYVGVDLGTHLVPAKINGIPRFLPDIHECYCYIKFTIICSIRILLCRSAYCYSVICLFDAMMSLSY